TCSTLSRESVSFSYLSAPLFFNAPPPTPIYTLSLHDGHPISRSHQHAACSQPAAELARISSLGQPRECSHAPARPDPLQNAGVRSEEHTSELQSPDHLVCRLLLEKKKKNIITTSPITKPRTT